MESESEPKPVDSSSEQPKMSRVAIALGFSSDDEPKSLAYYIEQENQLYRLACEIKGIPLEADTKLSPQ